MKKRNLFLSLICSIILTVALATFTIVGVVQGNKSTDDGNNAENVSTNVSDTKKEDVNANRDGSKDLPYLIYDVESFNHYVGNYGYTKVEPVMVPVMEESVDEEGNPILVEKIENGAVVMTEKLDDNGNVVYVDVCHYELAADIDFAGIDYVTLFNQDKPFNGKINGKGFALKNVTINVTKDNLAKFIYKNEANKNRYDAHIALFGKIEDAEIVELKLDNMKVSVSNDVYPYVYSSEFASEYGDAMNEITVSTLAAIAKNSAVKVDVEAQINADAYSIYTGEVVQGYNAVGGVVAVANRTTISDSNVDVKFTSAPAFENESKNYFVGGVAGYAYYSNIKNVNVDFEVSATYEQVLYIGGLVGYGLNDTIENANVNLKAYENNIPKTVKAGDTIVASDYTWVAGAVAIIQANSAELSTSLTNVNIVADVQIDAVYAGVVVEVWSTASSGEFVNFTDIVVNSNVNTLQAFGFARILKVSTMNLSKVEVDIENEAVYNIKLTGNVKLVGTTTNVVASLYTNNVVGKLSDVKIVVSNEIYNSIQKVETLRKYGELKII